MPNKLFTGFRKLFGGAVEPELKVESIPDLHVKSGADLMAHMARLDQVRTLFREGETHTGAADRDRHEDEELDYLFEGRQRFRDGLMNHSKPWYHTILLSGETFSSSDSFYSELVKRLKFGPVSPYASYQQTFDWLLSDLVSYLPEKSFSTPVFREHELRSLSPAAFDEDSIKATVGAAYLNNATLEFSYENERRRLNSNKLETHYRRVKVRGLYGNRGFRAWSHLGYRNFLFSKMRSAVVAPTEQALTPDVLVVVTFDGAGETTVRRVLLEYPEADVRKKLEEGNRGAV